MLKGLPIVDRSWTPRLENQKGWQFFRVLNETEDLQNRHAVIINLLERVRKFIKRNSMSMLYTCLYAHGSNRFTQPGIWLVMVLDPTETEGGLAGSCISVCISSSWSESGMAGMSCELACFIFNWLGTSVSTGPYCEVEPTSKSVDGFKPPNIFPHSNAYIR